LAASRPERMTKARRTARHDTTPTTLKRHTAGRLNRSRARPAVIRMSPMVETLLSFGWRNGPVREPMNDQRSNGLPTVTDQIALLVIRPTGRFVGPTTGMTRDRPNSITATSTSELIRHVRTIAEARDEDAMEIDAVVGLRNRERRIEEPNVVVLGRRRIEIPSTTMRIGVEKDRAPMRKRLEIEARACLRPTASVPMKNVDKWIRRGRRIRGRHHQRVRPILPNDRNVQRQHTNTGPRRLPTSRRPSSLGLLTGIRQNAHSGRRRGRPIPTGANDHNDNNKKERKPPPIHS
jgi:hypothetical protein